MKQVNKKLVRGCYDYLIIALAMVVGSLGWMVFLLPHKITIGGLPGISSVVFWATGIRVQYTYLAINVVLLAAALKVLGLRFCIKTIYAVSIFAVFTTLWQSVIGSHIMFKNEPFLACVVGGLLLGLGTGFSLLSNGSTGGSDVIAAIIHKYKDISLGYIVLFVMSYTVDHVINGFRRSVQFFVISEKYEEIGRLINNEANRGCTVIDAHGFYTGKKMGMLFIIAKQNESYNIFRIIDDVDPQAFVRQSAVSGG